MCPGRPRRNPRIHARAHPAARATRCHRWHTLRGSLAPLPCPRDPGLIGSVARQPAGDTGVVTKKRTAERTQAPRRFKVLLHNDDYTTMEFVVWLLQTVFHHDETTATEIMLHIHRRGVGVAGVYTREIAETRVRQVEALAREHEFP